MKYSIDTASIGKRIAQMRRAKKMKQDMLAEQLGVTPKHISHVERGVASLSLLNLAEVSRIFDCSLDYLIFGKENDKVLSLLPDLMIQILSSGTDKEIRRVQKYLDFYQELIESQDTI